MGMTGLNLQRIRDEQLCFLYKITPTMIEKQLGVRDSIASILAPFGFGLELSLRHLQTRKVRGYPLEAGFIWLIVQVAGEDMPLHFDSAIETKPRHTLAHFSTLLSRLEALVLAGDKAAKEVVSFTVVKQGGTVCLLGNVLHTVCNMAHTYDPFISLGQHFSMPGKPELDIVLYHVLAVPDSAHPCSNGDAGKVFVEVQLDTLYEGVNLQTVLAALELQVDLDFLPRTRCAWGDLV